MNIAGLFKKDFVIGLDIGASSVKIAQFKKTEAGLQLVKADLKEIKEEKEVVPALKDLFRAIDIKKSKVIAVINCPQTALKIARAPYMPKSELSDGIRLEAKSYFPFPIDDSLLDFEILGDVVDKGVRKYDIAVAVSPKKTVDRYLALLGKAGVKPSSFVSCPQAMQALVGSEEAVCMLDIGESNAELAIFKGKTLMFSRKIPVAGREFTKSMMGVLVSDRGKTELTYDEAERIKREVGIPAEGEPKIIEDKISTTQILAMLRSPAEQLVTEIERCFDYYREESGGGKIDSVTVFGGGAALGGLIKYLSDELGIEVKLGDYPDGGALSYRLNAAIGAALGEGKGINLLPSELKQEAKRIVKRGTIEVIATAVVLAGALMFIGMKIQLGNFETKINVAKLELSGLRPELNKAEAHHAVKMVLVDEPHWEDVFRELSHLIPNRIYLTRMTMKDTLITINGVINAKNGESILSNFIITLEKGIFGNVKLIRSQDLSDGTGNEFELKCLVE